MATWLQVWVGRVQLNLILSLLVSVFMLSSCLQEQENPACINENSKISGEYRIAIDNISFENNVIWQKGCHSEFIPVNLDRIDTESVDINASGIIKHYSDGFGVEITQMDAYSIADKSEIFKFFEVDSKDVDRIKIPE